MKFSGMVGNGPMNKWLNFDGDPDHSDCFSDLLLWEIQTVVNGHKSAAYTYSPDGSTSMMCLGGDMHCPSASSLMLLLTQIRSYAHLQ